MLGLIYANGREVLKDYEEAMKWYKLSAEQGNVLAQYKLGGMYGSGKGVPQDYAQAHMWFNLAGVKGNKDAVTYKNIAEQRMTSDQVSKAQRLASEWIEKHGKK